MAKIIDHSKNVLDEADRRFQQGLTKATLLVERSAKEKCPVKTGTLKRSITHDIEGRTAVVGSNVEYAPHVELGTSKMAARPYLRPALLANMRKIKQLFKGK